MRKVFDIHGGVHPAENKHQSTASAIGSIPLAEQIVLPLSQHIGAPAEPVVNPGDHVLKGQKIADAQGVFSAPVHASTSGIIAAIEDRAISHASGLMAPCIVLTPDGRDQWITLEPCEDYRQLDHKTLVNKIREAGVAGMGGAGFPTAVKLNPRADQVIHTLILNGTECEPYITADDMLMRERASEVVAGAQLLAHLLGNPATVVVGIEDNKPEAIAAMTQAADAVAASDCPVEIAVFPTKYPSGGEKQLIEILTGEQVPSGGLPAQIGIVVQNVGTAVAAWRAVTFGEPLISRVTTVVGESLSEQRNIDVPLGTPIRHVLQQHGWQPENCARLIVGGPMMGFAIDNAEAPIVKTTNCLLVPSVAEMPAPPPAQPCIRCGMCAEACPASLLPQQLFWYAQSENFDQLREHNLFDCIECGACSFVCPSNIPLVQYYRASKGAIRKLDGEKEKSDRSRVRFEARKARMEAAEAEKEAKRLARKQAAEEAKKLQAQKAGTTTANPVADVKAGTATDAPQKAVAAVDPEKEQAKLQRALTSAESRVERAREQLQTATGEGAEEARLESLRARLMQAEQKAADARKKLEQPVASASAVADRVKDKMTASPAQQLEKTIATLEKRLAAAREKHAEAVAAGSATADALATGVAKLEEKLKTNRQELSNLPAEETGAALVANQDQAVDAASAAIEKARQRAQAQAAMSPEEKAREQVASLQARLVKARERLAKAEAENNDNIDAFRLGVEKLETRLAEAEAELPQHTTA